MSGRTGMLRVTLAGLRAHRLRLAMTGLAIVLASGFVAGTLMLTDMMRAGAYESFAGGARQIDLAVLPPESGGTIRPSDAGEVEAVPGVRAVFADLRGPAPLLGKDGKVVGRVATLGVSLEPDNPAAYHDFVEGRAPTTPREAVLSTQTAERVRAEVGDTIRVVDHTKRVRTFRLVGIVDFGIDQEISRRGAVGLLPETLRDVTGVPEYRKLMVAARAGVVPAELRARVDAELGARYEVLTGQQLADRRVERFIGDIEAFTTVLLLFGLVAVGVATLVIYNTFQILVAQRMREMALLRCVGATRRQVFTSVLGESLGVGLVASVAGLALGLALAAGAYRFFAAEMIGSDQAPALASVGLVAPAATLAIGVGVTMVSGLLPARQATRVAPISALRTQADLGTTRFRVGALRLATAVVLCGGGMAATALGLTMDPGQTAMLVVAAGGAAVFLGVAALLPLVAGPLGRAIGWVPGRLFGVSGRLATDNTGRNPRRTATTTLALTVGVGLVTMLTVAMSTNRASVVAQIEEQFPVDFMIQAAPGTGVGPARSATARVPRELATALRDRPEIGRVIEVREARTKLGGKERVVRTVTESALGTAMNPEIEAGSLEAFGPKTVLLAEGVAQELGVGVGDRVPLRTPHAVVRVRVAATFSVTTPTIPSVLVPEDDFETYFGRTDDSAIYADAAAEVAIGDAWRAVEQAARPYPVVRVTTAGALKDQVTSSFNRVLVILAALLGLSIVIAVIGIANTLSLSVLERTRESALLRALGLTRRQLRGMLRIEAMIISVMGAGVGIALGLAYGWFGSRTVAEADNIVFTASPARIAGYVVLAGVIGVVAAALPARRAARTSVVTALADE